MGDCFLRKVCCCCRGEVHTPESPEFQNIEQAANEIANCTDRRSDTVDIDDQQASTSCTSHNYLQRFADVRPTKSRTKEKYEVVPTSLRVESNDGCFVKAVLPKVQPSYQIRKTSYSLREVSEPVPPKPRREGRRVANGPCARQPADERGPTKTVRVSRNSHQLAPGCEDRERTPSIEERLQHGHQRSYKHTVTDGTGMVPTQTPKSVSKRREPFGPSKLPILPPICAKDPDKEIYEEKMKTARKQCQEYTSSSNDVLHGKVASREHKSTRSISKEKVRHSSRKSRDSVETPTCSADLDQDTSDYRQSSKEVVADQYKPAHSKSQIPRPRKSRAKPRTESASDLRLNLEGVSSKSPNDVNKTDFNSSDDDLPYPAPTRPKVMTQEKVKVRRVKRSDVPSEGKVRTKSRVSTKATEVSADLRLNLEGISFKSPDEVKKVDFSSSDDLHCKETAHRKVKVEEKVKVRQSKRTDQSTKPQPVTDGISSLAPVQSRKVYEIRPLSPGEIPTMASFVPTCNYKKTEKQAKVRAATRVKVEVNKTQSEATTRAPSNAPAPPVKDTNEAQTQTQALSPAPSTAGKVKYQAPARVSASGKASAQSQTLAPAPAPAPVKTPSMDPVRTQASSMVTVSVKALTPARAPVPAPPPTPAPVKALTRSPVKALTQLPVKALPPARSPVKATVQVPAPAQSPVKNLPPARSPVKAPVQSPSSAQSPVQAPGPAQAPVQAPGPAQSPVQAPSSAQSPVQAPSPAESPVQAPGPVQSPVQAPALSPVKAPVIAMESASVKALATAPGPVQASAQAPAPAPASAQTPVVAHCSSKKTVMFSDAKRTVHTYSPQMSTVQSSSEVSLKAEKKREPLKATMDQDDSSDEIPSYESTDCESDWTAKPSKPDTSKSRSTSADLGNAYLALAKAKPKVVIRSMSEDFEKAPSSEDEAPTPSADRSSTKPVIACTRTALVPAAKRRTTIGELLPPKKFLGGINPEKEVEKIPKKELIKFPLPPKKVLVGGGLPPRVLTQDLLSKKGKKTLPPVRGKAMGIGQELRQQKVHQKVQHVCSQPSRTAMGMRDSYQMDSFAIEPSYPGDPLNPYSGLQRSLQRNSVQLAPALNPYQAARPAPSFLDAPLPRRQNYLPSVRRQL